MMPQKDIFGKRLNQLKITLSEQTRKKNAIRMGANPGFKKKKKDLLFFSFLRCL